MLSPFSERASHECFGVAANARSAPVAAEADDRVDGGFVQRRMSQDCFATYARGSG
jgi:hypothetical protein